ncbi:redox-regulated molecular chaperone Hsp33 [Thiocapsa imhoffii]|uniref:33 kDa chaperonin n=1 Tax=Thiocapsa imhoffii TaxID=382777 RepID=A0A9X0WHB8_9GAMM|nr:Hsp33 family molecular chaperone HslO [Thiocapsa imhoffii]MBK1644588.1 redox-regulated molecular chaperone Hsp33 [Thiocapsa imhoffii]
MSETDRLYRFLFEGLGIRGNLVHLDASWRAVQSTHPYPQPVRDLLGEALAAVTLLSATLKIEGSLILQAQGSGPLRTLVAQANQASQVRGLARWEGEVPSEGPLSARFGSGHLALSIAQRDGTPYQGIVPLDGPDLTAAIERYFRDSEQLPTRLWLSANASRAAGLLIQHLPSQPLLAEDWERIAILAATLTTHELTEQRAADLLYRLFNEETVRLFEPEPIAFRCGCSRQRIEDTLKLLGADEVDAILAEEGAVEVTCEFCNRRYRLDVIDAKQLFTGQPRHDPSPSQH